MPTPTADTAPHDWTLPLPRGRRLELGTAPAALRVMGVLNLTPDSFSDGGRWLEPGRAVERGLEMLAEGADLLDLGAESTRPGGGVYGAGAREVPAAEELYRLLPVLEPLRRLTDAPLSVDTRKGEVARRVLAAGADLVNDVGGLADPELAAAVAEAGCPLVLMHSRGSTATMQREAVYADTVAEVRDELAGLMARAEAAGVGRDRLVLDPGIGFAKGTAHNLELLGRLGELGALGRPLLVGASRKSFIGRLGGDAPPDRRLGGSLAAVGWAVAGGAAMVRVHDVAETVQFLAVWRAVDSARGAAAPGARPVPAEARR
jgi:dihydropteroate synthase